MERAPEYKNIQEILKWECVKTYRETRGGLVAIYKRRFGLWFYFKYTSAYGGGWYCCGSQEKFTHEDSTTGK